MKKNIFIQVLLVFVLIVSMLMPLSILTTEAASTTYSASVNDEAGVEVRKKATTTSTKLGTLEYDTQVTVYVKKSNGWSEIRYKKKKAYVKTESLLFFYVKNMRLSTKLGTKSSLLGYYSGDILNDRSHGEGKWTGDQSGRGYSGQFEDGMFHGQGTYTWPNGTKYVGELKDGLRNGQGTMTNRSGLKFYIGEFKDDMFHGQGTYTRYDGLTYVGEYKDDQYNGQGTLTSPDGQIDTGEFKDGELVGFLVGDWYVQYEKGAKILLRITEHTTNSIKGIMFEGNTSGGNYKIPVEGTINKNYVNLKILDYTNYDYVRQIIDHWEYTTSQKDQTASWLAYGTEYKSAETLGLYSQLDFYLTNNPKSEYNAVDRSWSVSSLTDEYYISVNRKSFENGVEVKLIKK